MEPETRTFDVFQGLIFAVDTKDRYTKQHSEDVARYGVFLARRLGLDPDVIATIRVAGLLHDVGKIGVPDHILRKPGTLTEAEYEIVKQHVALGDLIVRDLPDVESSGRASGTTTNAGMAPATSIGWPARTSRWSPGSWPSATPSRR